ncbi:MAG: hypothetical protein WAN58_03755 [Anaerolineales bacterium]
MPRDGPLGRGADNAPGGCAGGQTQAMIDLRVNVKRHPSGSSVNLAINQVRRPLDTLDC